MQIPKIPTDDEFVLQEFYDSGLMRELLDGLEDELGPEELEDNEEE
jgi:hypothetical protein